jgi:hypothetical protein
MDLKKMGLKQKQLQRQNHSGNSLIRLWLKNGLKIYEFEKMKIVRI